MVILPEDANTMLLDAWEECDIPEVYGIAKEMACQILEDCGYEDFAGNFRSIEAHYSKKVRNAAKGLSLSGESLP